MSDHTDAPDSKSHPQVDVTDLFAFQKPGDSTKSIFILNVNPQAPTQASDFDPEASYEVKIDTNADALPEIAFHVIFSPSDGTHQTAAVYRATGDSAQDAGPVGEVIIHNAPVSLDPQVRVSTEGEYSFYAGLRSDPWFADVNGVFNNFQFTGEDFFAEWNVFGIVLEVPNSALGPNPQCAIWGRTLLPVHGDLTPVDQVGRPLVNAIFNQEEQQDLFNRTPPARMRDIFLPSFVATLQRAGYSEDDATRTALFLLPDVLTYDHTSSIGFPNGRNLTDDCLDYMLNLSTNGKVTGDLTGAHTDFLSSFPYLGPPHNI
jgi:Domain of unknown function (DUF4331)